MESLTPQAKAALNWKWRGWWAREQQLAPAGDWRQWGYVAGRGAGKTRSGSEWVREQVQAGRRNLALIAPTAADARDVMVEGPSGILSVCWQHDFDVNGVLTGIPNYEPSKRRLTWENGAQALLFSAEEAERLRGPNFDGAWADELAAWKKGIDVWDMLMFALRLGDDPRAIFTTTPRVTPLIRRLMKDSGTVLTRGSTFDNRANLAAPALEALKDMYQGTRLGRQELYGELLEDVPGALWTNEMLDKARGLDLQEAQRIVVGVDPSGADGDPEGGSDDIGIVIAARFMDGTYAVLEDATCNLSPAGWGRRTVERYSHHLADCIVAEKNFGGAMVEAVIKSANKHAKVKMVTASRGKAVRAEPIAALYEQGRVAHAPGLEKLEEQMTHMTLTGYVGDGSPDRLDAAVWALTELTEGSTSYRDTMAGN